MVLDKKNAALAPKEESVADILSAIKDIVEGGSSNNNTVSALDSASNDDELLELTDVVEEFPQTKENVSSILPSSNTSSSQPAVLSPAKPVDILDQIDSVLEEENGQKEILEAVKDEIMHEFQTTFDAPAVEQSPVGSEAATLTVSEPVEETGHTHQEAHKEPQTGQINDVNATSSVFESLKPVNSPKTNLLSADNAKKSSLAIKNLLENIPKPEIISPSMRNGTTIEDIVVESMKPLLKEWLDQNLETIVRDIVEREIKKLIPKED